MDFFGRQDLARRNTRLLVVLFSIALVALVLLANLMLAGFFWLTEDYNLYGGHQRDLRAFLDEFTWQRFGWLSLLVGSTVGLVSLVTWISLASGGKHIAESLGGSRLLPQTDDPDERRCLNIVEEIALAAGMPVPDLYVLRGERGINAFAAGVGPADAVVAVTAGTLHHLDRDELQGVVAHEFSHILNGDMRMNIRLAALLKGITFLGDVGYFFLRSGAHRQFRVGGGRSRQTANTLPLLGIGLVTVGWLGGLAAGMIKSAISRQKEFLADASAVQFTRNPAGIANALKVIGGYIPGTRVHAARAPEMSHLFFGEVTHRLFQPFSTHPPLDTRIRRIDPRWDGQYIRRAVRHYENTPLRRETIAGSEDPTLVLAAAMAAGVLRESGTTASDTAVMNRLVPDTSTAEPEHAIPGALARHAHEPLGACAITLGFLLSPDASTRRRQLDLVEDHGITGLGTLTNTLGPAIAGLPPGARLPLINASLPALRAMSARQYRQFKETLLQLVQADGRTSLFEWCLYQLVRHYLDPEFVQARAATPRFSRLARMKPQLQHVLSMLAHAGSGDAESAFQQARESLDMPSLELLPIADCSLAQFSRSVHELADCYPLLKPRLLKAMEQAAGADQEICSVEREIIAAIAAVIDCPLPPSLQIDAGH